MGRTRRIALIKTSLVLTGALLGGVVASLAAAGIAAIAGDRSIFSVDDTIPLVALLGGLLGASLAGTAWGSLRYVPLRVVLLLPAAVALLGGLMGGLVAVPFGWHRDVEGGLVGSVIGFGVALTLLKRKYRAPAGENASESVGGAA